MGVEISLRELRAYATDAGPFVSVSQLYPTPAVEKFTVSPLLAERRRDEEVRRAARAEPAVRQLLASVALQPGTELTVRAAGPDAAVFAEWAATAARDRVVWTGTPSRPLRWAGDEAAELQSSGSFSVTGLVRHLYQQAQAAVPAGAATQLVVTGDGKTLAELAGVAGGPAPFDWAPPHQLLARIPQGRWATYGDVAAVIGTGAQPLGGHLADCPHCPNAWRILSANGRAAHGFRWQDGRDESVRDVLAREGVTFTGDVADASQRLSIAQLRQLLDAV